MYIYVTYDMCITYTTYKTFINIKGNNYGFEMSSLCLISCMHNSQWYISARRELMPYPKTKI